MKVCFFLSGHGCFGNKYGTINFSFHYSTWEVLVMKKTKWITWLIIGGLLLSVLGQFAYNMLFVKEVVFETKCRTKEFMFTDF